MNPLSPRPAAIKHDMNDSAGLPGPDPERNRLIEAACRADCVPGELT
jgi:hypothetical protein